MKKASIGQIVNCLNHRGEKIGKVVEIIGHEIIVENKAGVRTCELLGMCQPATRQDIAFFKSK